MGSYRASGKGFERDRDGYILHTQTRPRAPGEGQEMLV